MKNGPESQIAKLLMSGLGVGGGVAFGSWFTGSLGGMSGFRSLDVLLLVLGTAVIYVVVVRLVSR